MNSVNLALTIVILTHFNLIKSKHRARHSSKYFSVMKPSMKDLNFPKHHDSLCSPCFTSCFPNLYSSYIECMDGWSPTNSG